MLETIETLAPARVDIDQAAFDVDAIRRNRPILPERVNGPALAWFDKGSTIHKPQEVIGRLQRDDSSDNSTIRRAAHALAAAWARRGSESFADLRRASAHPHDARRSPAAASARQNWPRWRS